MNTASHRQQARQLLQQGQPDAATTLLESLVAQTPTDVEAWFLLGLARGQQANLTGAEQAFRRCTEQRRDAFAAWDNLGISLLQQERLAEAKVCFRTSIRVHAGNPVPHNGLGQLYRLQGNLPRSIAAYREALHIDPRFYTAHNNLSLALRAQGQPAEALRHARSAVEIHAGFAEAWHNLGELLHAQTDFEGALNALQQALHLKPTADVWCALGALMEDLNRRDAAEESYTRALELQADNLRAQIRLGVVLNGKGETDAARTRLEGALALHPGHPAATAELANILAVQGRYREAAQHLEPLLNGRDIQPEVALAYAGISARVSRQDQALALLERIDSTKWSPGQREGLHFALARLHEYAGRYERAFEHYRHAQTLRPLPDDLQQHLTEMQAIQTFFSRERLAALPHATHGSQRPVFIVGMPRSGTSLVEQILASHPQIHGGGELTALWKIVLTLPASAGGKPYPACVKNLTPQQTEQSAAAYLDALAALSTDALRITDKLPHNFLHLGLIQMLFPQAHVIHCLRDPLDTCLSIYSHRFNSSHRYARNLRSLGHYYRAYETLMAHWQRVLDLPLLTLRYEDLIDDVAGSSRRLIEFCGLDWDERCLQFHRTERAVNTPSHAQVRQPVYRSALGRWRHFEAWLGELYEGLDSGESGAVAGPFHKGGPHP